VEETLGTRVPEPLGLPESVRTRERVLTTVRDRVPIHVRVPCVSVEYREEVTEPLRDPEPLTVVETF